MPKPPNFFMYFGGKYKHAQKLIERFPEHQCYVDVFGGAGNVLIQKKPSHIEIFNDIDSDIVNLFRQVRDNSEAFIRKVSLVPHSREETYCFRERLKTETDTLQRAVMFWSTLNQAFSGTPRGWSFSKVAPTAKQLKNKIEKIHLITERLRNVSLEKKDFAYILERYDTEETFFYCDPPYLISTREKSKRNYRNEMSTAEHQHLLNILKDIKGKAMISGYKNDLYDSLGWRTYQFEVKQTTDRTPTTRIETVYMNY